MGDIALLRALKESAGKSEPTFLLLHSPNPSPECLSQSLRTCQRVIGVAHNPFCSEPSLNTYRQCSSVVGVSRYVIRRLQADGVVNVRPRPSYFPLVFNSLTKSPHQRATLGLIQRGPVVRWNAKKPRDLVLSISERLGLYSAIPRKAVSVGESGVRIGIVSRIARLKRFPELFAELLPVLSRMPDVSLHFFGSGSFREVKSLERVLSPVKSRVFFWGWQSETSIAYHSIDALLLGRPELEALGLNVFEAYAAQCPVIAVDGGPFCETVFPGINGWLLRDGSIKEDLLGVLEKIRGGSAAELTFQYSQDTLQKFSEEYFFGVFLEAIFE